MVIRLISVPDQLTLPAFHQIFCTMLGWSGNLDYIFRLHGREINSFRRKTRSHTLHEFRLHRQEKFLYICNTLDLWEWDFRVLALEKSEQDDHAPVCVGATVRLRPSFAVDTRLTG